MVAAAKRERTKTRKARAGRSGRVKIDSELNELAETRLGARIESMSYPGGKSRSTARARLKSGRSIMVSRRKSLPRATLEAKALEALSLAQMPVPRLLARQGRIVFQEDVGDERLSSALHHAASTAKRELLLDDALSGLAAIHKAGSQARLDRDVPILGADDAWRRELAARPAAIGDYLKHPAPKIDIKATSNEIRIRQPRFVKWDARPGNALVADGSRVMWIDWEHCGARNRLDDMIWLLADEYVEDDEAMETSLIDRHIADFADELDVEAARDYFMTFGTLHVCIRLALILDRKGDGDWWDVDYCLDGDKIGITRQMAERQCRRGARWSAASPHLEPLAPWFTKIGQVISRL